MQQRTRRLSAVVLAPPAIARWDRCTDCITGPYSGNSPAIAVWPSHPIAALCTLNSLIGSFSYSKGLVGCTGLADCTGLRPGSRSVSPIPPRQRL